MYSFRYQLTTKEMFYLLFKKKICPKCGGTMKKEKCYEIVDGSIFNSNSEPLYIRASSKVKNYFYRFTCEDCGAEFTLSELAK